MRGKEKMLGLVYDCGYSSELLSFWIHYYFCLTGLVVCFLGWGVVGVGGVWIHLLLLLHIYTLPII